LGRFSVHVVLVVFPGHRVARLDGDALGLEGISAVGLRYGLHYIILGEGWSGVEGGEADGDGK
jgi:hypothetical protein